MSFLRELDPIFGGIYVLCMLLPPALMSLAAPCFWRRHYGKIFIFWAVAFTVFCVASFPVPPYLVHFDGAGNPIDSPVEIVSLLHFLLFAYLPAVILLFTLSAIGGGIRLTGRMVGTPKLNVFLLVVGWMVSGFFNGLVAAGLLIPILFQVNAHRRYRFHSLVFFLLAVMHISGYLTNVLYLLFFDTLSPEIGFLQNGNAWFWLTLSKACAVSVIISALYFALDAYLFKREGSPAQPDPKCGPVKKLRIEGLDNLLFLAALAAATLLPDVWTDSPAFGVYTRQLDLSVIVSYALMLGIAIAARLLHRPKNC